MQLVNDTQAYSVSDADARRWVREARLEELRQRSGYYTAAFDRRDGEIAGGWADDDESLIGSDEPVAALAYLDALESPAVVRAGEGFEPELVEEDDRDSWLEDARTLAQDRAQIAWLLRDVREEQAEARARRRTAADKWLERGGETVVKPRVVGDYWGAGPDAEKRWLDAQIAQLRIDARELLDDAERKGWSRKAARSSAQFQAIARQAESLRHRHNYKRYVEALYCDAELAGKDFAAKLTKVDAKRRAAKLSYAKAVEALAGQVEARNAEALMGEREWVGVEGLIAA